MSTDTWWPAAGSITQTSDTQRHLLFKHTHAPITSLIIYCIHLKVKDYISGLYMDYSTHITFMCIICLWVCNCDGFVLGLMALHHNRSKNQVFDGEGIHKHWLQNVYFSLRFIMYVKSWMLCVFQVCVDECRWTSEDEAEPMMKVKHNHKELLWHYCDDNRAPPPIPPPYLIIIMHKQVIKSSISLLK